MRIAQIAPLAEAVPPKRYGGTERVVSYLTEELVALGHDVTLFASGDSATSARLVPMWPRATAPGSGDPRPAGAGLPHAGAGPRARRRVRRPPLPPRLPALLAVLRPAHALPEHDARPLDLPEIWPLYEAHSDVPLVSISDAQRRPMPRANWVATVHHGLPERLLTPQPGAALLPGLPRAHLAREARGPGHRDRRPRRPAAEDRGQGRPGGPRLLRGAHPPVAQRSRTSSSSARSARRRRPSSSPAPTPCCSRSTGRSRSGW